MVLSRWKLPQSNIEFNRGIIHHKTLLLKVAVANGAESECPQNGLELQLTVCNSGHSTKKVYTNVSKIRTN
jgi:hypothetical protein